MSRAKPVTVAEVVRMLQGPQGPDVLQQLGSAIRADGAKRVKAYTRSGGPVDLARRLETYGAAIASIAPVLKQAPPPPRRSFGYRR